MAKVALEVSAIPGIITTRARQLRTELTDSEKRLWKHLRVLNREGYHFRRQAPVGPYIADFFEHAHRLVIECDGDQHVEDAALKYDARRDAWFAEQGYRVIRVSNREALTITDGVLVTILEHCGLRVGANDATPVVPLLPNPPPQGGRESQARSGACGALPQQARAPVPLSKLRASGNSRRGTGNDS